jgi:hypothetical protein
MSGLDWWSIVSSTHLIWQQVGGVAGQDPHCSGPDLDFMLVRWGSEPDPDRTFGPGEGVGLGLHQFLPEEMV